MNLGPSNVTASFWTELACKIKRTNQLLQELVSVSNDSFTSEVELIPNNTTGVYDQITYSWINGVAQPPVTVPTLYPIAQQVTKDVEYLPNNITGFYDKIVHTYINGVLQPDVITPTIYPITGLPPAQHDFEYVCDSSTGFIQEIEKITDSLGIVTTVTTATTITCEKTCTSFGILGELTSWSQII